MLRSSRRDVVHCGGLDVFLPPARRPRQPVGVRGSVARCRGEERQARAVRTIVVQDALRPYLTGAGATNCLDFHKVFHSLCGSISGTAD